MTLDESTYNALISALFKQVLAALDAEDPDVVEADSTGDMLTISSSRGEKVVVNTQRAVRQVWVAGQGRGLHFSYDLAQRRWFDDRGEGLELREWIKSCVAALSGINLKLAAD